MRVELSKGVTAEIGMVSKCQFLSNKLDRKFYGLNSKKKIAVLALPKSLAQSAIWGLLIPLAFAVDRFVSVIDTCRDSKTPVSLKARKCILLPVKLALIVPLTTAIIACIPLGVVANTVSDLEILDERKRKNLSKLADDKCNELVEKFGQPA